MSRTKAQLIERAESLGIKNGADIPYDQLAAMIHDIQAGGALARANTKKPTSTKRKAIQRSRPASPSTVTARAAGPINEQQTVIAAPTAGRPIRTNFRVTFYSDHEGMWRWNLKSVNGEIVADSSEGYVTKWGCKRAFKKAIGY